MKKYFDFGNPVFRRRLFMSIIGTVILAGSVGILKTAALGIDPFSSFVTGLDEIIPLDYGTIYIILNAALLLFSLVFDKHYIGIATMINLFLLGYITQWSYEFFSYLFPNPGIAVRVILFAVAIIIICFSSALYMTADLGVSTYDAIALIIANTWKKGQFKFDRIMTDLACLIIGGILLLISGYSISRLFTVIGFGTIVTALCMGPLIDFFNEKVARPFLRSASKNQDA